MWKSLLEGMIRDQFFSLLGYEDLCSHEWEAEWVLALTQLLFMHNCVFMGLSPVCLVLFFWVIWSCSSLIRWVFSTHMASCGNTFYCSITLEVLIPASYILSDLITVLAVLSGEWLSSYYVFINVSLFSFNEHIYIAPYSLFLFPLVMAVGSAT